MFFGGCVMGDTGAATPEKRDVSGRGADGAWFTGERKDGKNPHFA